MYTKVTTVMRRIHTCISYVVLFFLVPASVSARDLGLKALSNLSLAELLNVEIRLTNLKTVNLEDSPASVTLITRQQIELTPARNILDLLETYVPGLSFYNGQTSGPEIRIRGLGQRNFNTLLLINGRQVNQKSYQGSMVELRNWDMSDIERIEVVRGPGSVTQGAGAISGVINIITRTAESMNGVRIGVDYNDKYQSKGLQFSYGKQWAESKFSFHASIQDSDGVKNPKIFQSLRNGQIGYKGDSTVFSGNDGNPVQSYYGDFDSDPQIKLHADYSLNDDWRFWVRYTNSGQKIASTQRLSLGRFQDFRTFENRHFIATVENSHTLNSDISISSTLSFDSEEYQEFRANNANVSHLDELNRRYNFSENEVFLRSILTYQQSDWSLSTGIEYSHDYLEKPWGDPDSSFRVRAGRENFISDDSLYRGDGSGGTIEDDDVVRFTDGWSANSWSLMAELDYDFSDTFKLLVSGRSDKNQYSDSLFSPRLAFISKPSPNHLIRASWQKSRRMNTMMELYWLDINDIDSEPESNETFEVAYSYDISNSQKLTTTGYVNNSDVFSWAGANQELVGVVKSWGLEFEYAYRTPDFSLGFNHSYLNLKDWDYRSKSVDGSTTQDVSYSDIFVNPGLVQLTDTGSSLNYWSHNHTKLWLNFNLFNNWLLHVNARVAWGSDYGEDLFSMYQHAYANADTTQMSANDLNDYNENLDEFNNFNKIIKQKDAYGKDIRLNASLVWHPSYQENLKVIFYAQNLFNFTDNVRDKRGSTQRRELPVVSWVEEPSVYGIKFVLEFD